MTRNKRIAKLGNAILEYRGRRNPKTQKWITPPNPSRASGIDRWARTLGLNIEGVFKRVNSFKTIAECDSWLRSL